MKALNAIVPPLAGLVISILACLAILNGHKIETAIYLTGAAIIITLNAMRKP